MANCDPRLSLRIADLVICEHLAHLFELGELVVGLGRLVCAHRQRVLRIAILGHGQVPLVIVVRIVVLGQVIAII